MPLDSTFVLHLDWMGGTEFRVRFDDPSLQPLTLDEPPPFGAGLGPSPSRILAAAIANCLAASFAYGAHRARLPLDGLSAEVRTSFKRNARGRLRIDTMSVELEPVLAEPEPRFSEIVATFEDFCLVTQSVREGIDVQVRVEPRFRSLSSFAAQPQ